MLEYAIKMLSVSMYEIDERAKSQVNNDGGTAMSNKELI